MTLPDGEKSKRGGFPVDARPRDGHGVVTFDVETPLPLEDCLMRLAALSTRGGLFDPPVRVELHEVDTNASDLYMRTYRFPPVEAEAVLQRWNGTNTRVRGVVRFKYNVYTLRALSMLAAVTLGMIMLVVLGNRMADANFVTFCQGIMLVVGLALYLPFRVVFSTTRRDELHTLLTEALRPDEHPADDDVNDDDLNTDSEANDAGRL